MTSEKNINISVLIPAHGEAPYLLKALESISIQKFPNKFEILLVTQNLSQVALEQVKAQKYANLRIITDTGSGLISALNLGLNQAEFNWIARLDSDDVMHQSRIERQSNAVRKNPELILVGGQIQSINDRDEMGHRIKYPKSNFAIKLILKVACAIPHPGVLARKDLIQKVGGYSLQYPHVEDYELWCRLSKLGKFKNLRSTVVYYRIHPEQVTRKHQTEINRNLARVLASNFAEIGDDLENEIRFFHEISSNLTSRNYLRTIKSLLRSKVSFSIKFQYLILRLTYKLILLVRI
jgi:glycosyltransferase involved in cell wall biosynthesis